MPDAQGHDLITVVTGVAMVTPAYAAFAAVDPEHAALRTGVLFGAHLLSGIMFSPDLDLDSAIDDRWGIFYWIWRPYTYIVPHRHFWSHGLIVPPLFRLGYFIGVLMLLAYLLARGMAELGVVVPDYHTHLADTIVALVAEYPDETLVLLLGFITGGAAHSIADWLVTGGKRYLTLVGYRPRRDYSSHDRSIHRRRGAWAR